MRELLRSEWGCTVVEASHGLEAWQLLNSGLTIDLCICDLRMPKMGGLELVGKLLSDPRFIMQKIMICSTENERATVVKAASLGVNGYLLKPFLAEDFLAHVRKLCGKADEAGTPESLESPPITLDRLRIGKKKYLELMDALTTQVMELVAELGVFSVGNDPTEIKLRLGAVRGAGLTLGALPLGSVIARLEHSLATVNEVSLASYRSAIEVENKRVMAITAKIAAEQSVSSK